MPDELLVELPTEEPPQTLTEAGGDYSVLAAEIAGAHGVSGSLRLRLVGTASDAAARSLQAGQTVRLVRAADGFRRDLTLAGLRKQPQPKGAWIVHFKEIKDRTQAETLHGCGLLIREAERAPLTEGEYYVDDLLGMDVVSDQGRPFGRLSDVLNTPANDVWVTDSGALIPAAGDFIVDVDVPARRITVRDVPGLVDEPAAQG